MKKTLFTILIVSLFISCNQKNENKTTVKSTPEFTYDESQKETNDFYDDAETHELKGARTINVVAANDLLTERNISDPVKITVVKEILEEFFTITKENISTGRFVITAQDGYRAIKAVNGIYFKIHS